MMGQEGVNFIESVVGLIFGLATGLFLLLLGRRYFWLLGGLAVAALGFGLAIAGIAIAFQREITLVVANETSEAWLTSIPAELAPYAGAILLAIVVGLAGGGFIGALLLLRAPRAVATLFGLVAGALLLGLALSLYRIAFPTWLEVILVVAAGIATAYFARRNPDTSLIVLSTLLGTAAITSVLRLDPDSSVSAIIGLCLMLVGILYQTYTLRKREAKARMALAHAYSARLMQHEPVRRR